MNLKEAIADYLITKQPELTNKTHRWYESKLRLFCDWCRKQQPPTTEVEQITPVLISRFTATLTGSSHTRHGYVQVVKGLLNWCVENEEGDVALRTINKIKLPRLEKSQMTIFTQDELRRLLLACDHSPFPKRNRALVSLLLDTGARASELVYDPSRQEERTGLLLEDVYLNGADAMRPYVLVMGKGRKPRELPLGQMSKTSLRLYIRNYRFDYESPYVFLSRIGEPLTVRGLENVLTEIGKVAQVAEIYPHKFRHTMACMFLLNGGNINDLKTILGHEDIRTTMIYLRAIEGMGVRDRAHSVLDQIKLKR